MPVLFDSEEPAGARRADTAAQDTSVEIYGCPIEPDSRTNVLATTRLFPPPPPLALLAKVGEPHKCQTRLSRNDELDALDAAPFTRTTSWMVQRRM